MKKLLIVLALLLVATSPAWAVATPTPVPTASVTPTPVGFKSPSPSPSITPTPLAQVPDIPAGGVEITLWLAWNTQTTAPLKWNWTGKEFTVPSTSYLDVEYVKWSCQSAGTFNLYWVGSTSSWLIDSMQFAYPGQGGWGIPVKCPYPGLPVYLYTTGGQGVVFVTGRLR